MFSSNRERYDAKCYLSVYVPWVSSASSMQLHTFVPGIDVARRALSVIFTPPFQTGSTGKRAPKIIICILYETMIPYGNSLVNYAQAQSTSLLTLKSLANYHETSVLQ
ncbi:MAG: hypothetical protein ACYDER_28710 [Ktedonobacteraceae bacterium]